MTEYTLTVHRLNRKLFWGEPITAHERYLIYRVLSEDAQYEMGALADKIEQEEFLENKLAAAKIEMEEFKAFTGVSDEAMHFWTSQPIYGEAEELLTYIICCCHYEKYLSINSHLFPVGDNRPDDLEAFLKPYDYIE